MIDRFRAKEYDTDNYPTDPISACTSALVGDATTIAMAAADIPRDLFKAAVGTPRPHSPGNPASEGSKEGVPTPTAMQTTGSDTASILSTARSMDTGNSSAHNLTPTSSATSGQAAPRTASPFATVAPRQRNTTSSIAESMLPDNANVQLERVLDTGKSINNIVATGLKSPMNFCMGLAKGFRNAPTLYNDDTVRPTEKVTSFSSGLRVAGKEFGLGLFDGITGLVTQPMKGAEKEGAAGLLKGFGKGIGGLILKPSAGKS